jgi:hypothetical protein
MIVPGGKIKSYWMRMADKGIVLRTYQPYKNQVCLIDKVYGRIDAIIFKGSLMAGSMIEYRLEERRHGPMILNDIVLHEAPLLLARHDILFLHHLLELCYHFIPIASGTVGVFDLLQVLYSADIQQWHNESKKLFLFRVLMCIGMYSTQIDMEKALITLLVNVPLGTAYMAELAKNHADLINKWLHACVREHPYVQKFKTIHFLMRE